MAESVVQLKSIPGIKRDGTKFEGDVYVDGQWVRFQRGLPIFWGSPDHIAIRLRHWGMSVPQIVVVSCVATAVVGGIGLMLMTVDQELATFLCFGTVVVLVAATFVLKRIDVRKSGAAVVTTETEEGMHAA